MGIRPCRFARHRRIALAALVPPLVWALVVAFAPTDWARRLAERELSNATHGRARVESVRLGILGGIRLLGVDLFETDRPASGPWLHADHIRVDLGMVALAFRGPKPRRIVVEGLRLQVGRREDGSFPLARLLGHQPIDPNDSAHSTNPWSDPDESPVGVSVTGGTLTINDVPSQTKLELVELSLDATLLPGVVHLERLEAEAQGGTLGLALEVERGDAPAFDLKVKAQGLQLDGSVPPLGYLLPFLAGVEDDRLGVLALELDLKGRGADLATVRRSLAGQGRVRIDPVSLNRSRLTRELSRVVPLPQASKVGSLSSEFVIADERITTPSLAFGVAGRRLTLGGATTFEGAIHYQIEARGLADDLSPEVGELVRNLDLDNSGLLRIEILGTLDSPTLHLNGRRFDHAPAEDPIRELSRIVRERFLR